MKAKTEEMEILRKHNLELEQKLQKLLMEFTMVRTKAQEMLINKDQEIKKWKINAGKSEEEVKNESNENNSGIESDSSSDDEFGEKKKTRGPSNSFSSQIDNTSRAYIKNVLLKYLEYQALAQEKEQLIMEKVLFTVLKVHENEIKILEDARVRSYNSGILSYIWAADEEKMVAHPVKPRAYNPSERKK